MNKLDFIEVVSLESNTACRMPKESNEEKLIVLLKQS